MRIFSFTSLRWFLLVLIGGTCSCVGLSPHDSDEEGVVVEPADLFPITPGAPLNDRAIRRHLIKGAVALHEAGDTVSIATLAGQRDRSRCRLELPEPSSALRSAVEVFADQLAGVLVLGELYNCGKCERWHVSQATGFFITRDGVFVTNHHVFEKEKAVTLVAMTSDGVVHPVVEVLAANENDDVAIARIRMESSCPIPLQADASVGSAVSLISHPDGNYYLYTQGHVARYSRRRTRSGTQTRMAVTADFAKGSSGGPLLDPMGNAVGMVCSTHSIYYEQDKEHLQMVIKHCIPSRSILGLIDAPE